MLRTKPVLKSRATEAEISEIYAALNWRMPGFNNCRCRSFIASLLFRECFDTLLWNYCVAKEAASFYAHCYVSNSAGGKNLSDLNGEANLFKKIHVQQLNFKN